MNDGYDPTPQIGGYEITRRLGRGGMADVYLAVQTSLSRPVAIKVLAVERTDGEETVTRFEHEARTIARLDHPNIVSIFDVGRTADGRLYYVMPYLPNGDLSTRDLRDDEAAVVGILRALTRALGYAHKLGIVHRDVKPENVLFDKLDRPLLADFGIALASGNFARVTREGSTIGSSGYMSPEQARGFAIDGRADLYSLGVVAYEMLSGDLPYHGPDTLSVALAHVEQPIPRLPLRRRRWQSFIDKAMAKSPDERFQSAEQMEAALDHIAQQIGDTPDAAYATKPLPAVAAPAARRAFSGMALAVVVALAGALMVGYALQKMRRDSAGVTAAAATNSPHDAPAETVPPPPTSVVAPAAESIATNDEADAAAAPAATTTAAADAKPVDPPKPKLSDLAAGTLVRDRGGPDLVVVAAPVAHGSRADGPRTFALGRDEVTRKDYAAFVAATGRAAAKCREPHSPLSTFRKLSWREPGFAQDDSHPVVCVSWDDANAYVQWLAARLHARYRLPTRAEWSFANRWAPANVPACQQGNLADSARRDAGACNDGFAYTAPVGKFKPNGIGIRDLVGNVSEWTSDCKGGGSADCGERMFSGVSWRDDAEDVGRQDDAGTDTGYTTIGIRVVRELADDSLPPAVK